MSHSGFWKPADPGIGRSESGWEESACASRPAVLDPEGNRRTGPLLTSVPLVLSGSADLIQPSVISKVAPSPGEPLPHVLLTCVCVFALPVEGRVCLRAGERGCCVLQMNILVDTGSSNFAVAAAPHPFITHFFNTAL